MQALLDQQIQVEVVLDQQTAVLEVPVLIPQLHKTLCLQQIAKQVEVRLARQVLLQRLEVLVETVPMAEHVKAVLEEEAEVVEALQP